ncbi:MAG: DUF2892 domain-containing protein [Halieaceae bacterium]|jgi:hypothetical protein|nr:DUF2892 domain-containing protein [Halieaceae bacterium]
MTIERLVLAIAGFFILASLALAQLVHPYWLWFTAFVGANLFQSAFTGFCPLAIILRKLGRECGPAFCRGESTKAAASAP